MIVEVALFGFGDERPVAFAAGNQLALTLAEKSTLDIALKAAGIADSHGISAILNGTSVSRNDWDSTVLAAGDVLKLLMAIEGG